MVKQRLFNETDETIIIEPGDSIDIVGEMETKRLMAQRRKQFKVEGVEEK